MHRVMPFRGFAVILALVLALFLTFHLLMRGDLTRKAAELEARSERLSELQEEQKDLKAQLSIVGTEDYIVSSALENYSYVRKDDIRFEFTNPGALYTYTEKELEILVDEMGE